MVRLLKHRFILRKNDKQNNRVTGQGLVPSKHYSWNSTVICIGSARGVRRETLETALRIGTHVMCWSDCLKDRYLSYV